MAFHVFQWAFWWWEQGSEWVHPPQIIWRPMGLFRVDWHQTALGNSKGGLDVWGQIDWGFTSHWPFVFRQPSHLATICLSLKWEWSFLSCKGLVRLQVTECKSANTVDTLFSFLLQNRELTRIGKPSWNPYSTEWLWWGDYVQTTCSFMLHCWQR